MNSECFTYKTKLSVSQIKEPEKKYINSNMDTFSYTFYILNISGVRSALILALLNIFLTQGWIYVFSMLALELPIQNSGSRSSSWQIYASVPT